MDNEFIRLGLEEDRWLKAERLSERFIAELKGELTRIGEETITERPDLFVDNASGRWREDSGANRVIAYARIQYPMTQVNIEDGDQKRLRFNFGLQWLDPATIGEATDNIVCYPRYKIKNLPEEDFQEISRLTREEMSAVKIKDDPWNSAPGMFYVPVSDPPEIGNGLELIQEHFLQYAHLMGSEPSD